VDDRPDSLVAPADAVVQVLRPVHLLAVEEDAHRFRRCLTIAPDSDEMVTSPVMYRPDEARIDEYLAEGGGRNADARRYRMLRS
jgi:hypothetical protein